MNDVLHKAREHFARMRGQSMTVPEWGLEVHFDPLTMRERQALQSAAKGSDAQAAILVVVRHAKGAGGERLFADDAKTRKTLENEVDPAVIGRIAAAILGASDPDDLGES
ncbi:hypothetical protein [Oceanicella actignis]|uniref:Tail assembly chaperone n=1 Tax=Oceanicella actignis TaxID=1189325 RepID=A0A1M7U1H6_9RHOB|nr:hypothetical protein [Oceanicella actignis]SES76740.1 hypothetical protein SAMN04488119_101402 [Oceanicella actignis]SHN76912.1 hypothetical protein SAMN05216200_11420 [Oceanicella actignis]